MQHTIRWLLKQFDIEISETRVMCVNNAFVCFSCHAVLADCRRGSCVICGSESVEALGWLLAPAKQRQEWISKIRGKRTDRRFKIIPLDEGCLVGREMGDWGVIKS